VHPDADREVVEAAYRQLMRKYLSDIAGGDTVRAAALHKRATAINQAHAVLRDPGQRRIYDGMRNGSGVQVGYPNAREGYDRARDGYAGAPPPRSGSPDPARAPTPSNDPYAVPEVLAYTDPGRITSPLT
jgi:curved DNA-binding protein CbpA